MKALIFDFDGVIVETRETVVEAFQEAFQEVLGEEVEEKKIDGVLSKGLSQVAVNLGVSGEEAAMIAEMAWEKSNRKTTERHIVPGVREFLEKARERHKTALVSMNKRPHLEKLLDEFGLDFEVVVTIDDVVERRPHPEGLERAMEELGVGAEETTVFGDTPNDMLAAKRAGCRPVGVLTGLGDEESLKKAGAEIVLRSVNDFPLD